MPSSDSSNATSRPESMLITRADGDTGSSEIQRGTQVSRYLVLDMLGAGGMGRVFTAHDPELDRQVAIKVLFDESTSASSSGANELLREGRALASLRHPNIVSVYDVGWHEGELFIAMEYVEGQTLGAWQRETPRSSADILARYLEAGEALTAAHDAGVVHGDFKPSNVMVEPSGRAVVLDFGLALSMRESPTPADGDQENTRRGVGTPAYMAPEQHLHERATPASDQFAFCVALYEAFVGQRPFPQKSMLALTQAVLEGTSEDPGDRMPRWVWREVQRGLQVDPRERHPDMRTLLQRLDPAPRRRKQVSLALGLAGLATVIGVATAVSGAEPCAQARPQLGGTWDAETRATLEQRFGNEEAWAGVRTQLDAFSERWLANWTEACEATHVHETQSEALLDRRMACLEADRVAVEIAVTHLRSGERDTLQRAVSSNVFDRDGSGCRADALVHRRPPPPEGPARDAYDALRRDAMDLYVAAAFENDARAVLQRVEALPLPEDVHPDIAAAVEHTQAEAHYQLGQYEQAREAWMRAARAADAAGDDISFVHLASILAFLDASKLDRIDAAAVWVERAHSRAQTVELPDRERLLLALRGATVLRHQGKLLEAAEALQHLLDTAGPSSTAGQRGTAHHNLGEILFALNRHTDAEDAFRSAIELRTSALGSDHRDVGHSRFYLSRVLIEGGNLDEAAGELERAANIFAHVEGGGAERVMTEESRAILSAMRGDIPLALRQMKAVLTLARELLEPKDRRHATLHINYGRMLMMAGQLDTAAEEAERGLRMEEEIRGPTHHDLVNGLSLLGEIELNRGNPRAAHEHCERALSLAKTADERLALGLTAWMCQAHVDCDAAAATREANALIDGSGATESTRTEAKARLEQWPQLIADYPACKGL